MSRNNFINRGIINVSVLWAALRVVVVDVQDDLIRGFSGPMVHGVGVRSGGVMSTSMSEQQQPMSWATGSAVWETNRLLAERITSPFTWSQRKCELIFVQMVQKHESGMVWFVLGIITHRFVGGISARGNGQLFLNQFSKYFWVKIFAVFTFSFYAFFV